MSILMTEYDYATDMAVQKEEAYEDGLSIGLERGLAQGAHEKALETAQNLLSEGLAPAMVARCTSLPLETIIELAQTE